MTTTSDPNGRQSETSNAYKMAPEHERALNGVINTGLVESWDELKLILRGRFRENVEDYRTNPSPVFTPKGPKPSTNEGHVEPPFKPRVINPERGPTRTLSSDVDRVEANSMCDTIIELLDNFEGAPFTIRRICELALLPRNHYRTVGKYLRGLERTLLVTSPLETFDISTESESSVYTTLGLDGALTQPTTPIFSPIPFLHEDARERSKSPTPLHLDNSLAPGGAPANAVGNTKALGLVDELDTPAPGHMSNYPMPLTATTDLPGAVPKTLEDRFVKAKEDSPPSTSESEGGSVSGEERVEEKSPERREKVKAAEKEKDESNEDAEVENMILGND